MEGSGLCTRLHRSSRLELAPSRSRVRDRSPPTPVQCHPASPSAAGLGALTQPVPGAVLVPCPVPTAGGVRGADAGGMRSPAAASTAAQPRRAGGGRAGGGAAARHFLPTPPSSRPQWARPHPIVPRAAWPHRRVPSPRGGRLKGPRPRHPCPVRLSGQPGTDPSPS